MPLALCDRGFAVARCLATIKTGAPEDAKPDIGAKGKTIRKSSQGEKHEAAGNQDGDRSIDLFGKTDAQKSVPVGTDHFDDLATFTS